MVLAATLVGAGALALGAGAAGGGYHGRHCPRLVGHHVTDCRVARHGAPDLSRNAWHALYGAEVSITYRIHGLAPNPGAGGARSWPLIDSLGQPMGRLAADTTGRYTLTNLAGRHYRVGLVNLRGRGCAASRRQSRTFPLVQVVALAAPASGTQAFINRAALDRTRPEGRAAYAAFMHQHGTGCGPARPEVGRVRRLRNPNVGAVAHARLGNGELNTVTEYDAKREFGNVVYFSSNTTEVHAGGIARGMVRVGTRVATADVFPYCDPNSDGTLVWRYVAIRTGHTDRPRLFGWVPGRCPYRR